MHRSRPRPPALLAVAVALLTLTARTHAQDPSYQIPFFADSTPPPPDSAPPIYTITPDQWAALNTSVEGRLFAGVPFAKPCFSMFEGREVGVDGEGCEGVQRGYANETIRTAAPAGQINPQWETCQSRAESCLLDYTDPFNNAPDASPHECKLGSVSEYYIKIQTAADIQSALAFSRTTHVPLVIKNTGHDYKGRSSAPASLGLWMHGLQEITYHPAFTPTCSDSAHNMQVDPVQAVTLGAGVQWFQAYAFAEEKEITLVGGADRTVGTTGGWLQGGGHGALSNTLGMGADRVLEFTVVTSDGVLRTANDCQNQDLFFALRGGGGGTFGVVLSATTLASPRVNVHAVLVEFPPPPPASHQTTQALTTHAFWSLLLTHATTWAQDGWGAYITANSALYVNPVLGKEEAGASIKPLVEWAQEMKKGAQGVVVVEQTYGSWAECYNVFVNDNSADLAEPLAIASRLIPASTLSTPASRTAVLEALLAGEAIAPGVRLLATTPYNYPPRAESPSFSFPSNSNSSDASTPPPTHPTPPSYHTAPSALNPAWRSAVFHVTAVTPWNWNASRAEMRERYETAGRAVEGLRKLTGGEEGAAYVNEADVYEPGHEKVFWGENYGKLLEIKERYDPDRLLDCWHCVGWERRSPRFECYM
ncbi:FAD-binding domain-containing protein [Ramaria rubella]|nr:FAD-binding domain-containing protein [Ramaria rubella]